MAQIATLKDLFIHELKDCFDFEQQIIQALPKLIAKVSAPELKHALSAHLEETRGQVARLEKVFGLCGLEPERRTCAGMKGVMKEADETLAHVAPGPITDAAVIACCQKVEHYEICSYGTLRTYAEEFGGREEARLIDEILLEEKAADQKLTALAEGGLNRQATRSDAQPRKQPGKMPS